MNERKEQHAINEALLWNMTGGSSHGKPTHSTNKFKKYFYHKWASNPKEEGKEEHTPEPLERDYHSLSSDNSLSPCRKKQKKWWQPPRRGKKDKSPNLWRRYEHQGERWRMDSRYEKIISSTQLLYWNEGSSIHI